MNNADQIKVTTPKLTGAQRWLLSEIAEGHPYAGCNSVEAYRLREAQLDELFAAQLFTTDDDGVYITDAGRAALRGDQ